MVRSFHQSLESELEEAGYWWEDKARQAPEAKHWVARQGKALCGQGKALGGQGKARQAMHLVA